VPNAFEVNPGMMDALAQITPQNLPQLLFANPELVPEHFRKAFWKNVKSFFQQLGINTVGGIALNMVVTRTLPRVLILPVYVRIPVRLLIFASPFALTYGKLSDNINTYDDMLEEQYIKLQKFRKTGNIEEYFG
jgi:hypothetical protein